MKKTIELFDRVKVKDTGEIGYVVDISPADYLILEKESEDELVYNLKITDVELLNKRTNTYR